MFDFPPPMTEPNREKTCETDENESIRFAVCAMPGWRPFQEDAHNCILDYNNGPEVSFFALYDGHAGIEVPQYLAQHFPDYLKRRNVLLAGPDNDNIIEAELKSAFVDFDATLLEKEAVEKMDALLLPPLTEEESPEGPAVKRRKMEEGEEEMPTTRSSTTASGSTTTTRSSTTASGISTTASSGTSTAASGSSSSASEAVGQRLKSSTSGESVEKVEEEEAAHDMIRAGYYTGSTACVALVFKERIVVANIGDSHAVLCRASKALDLSTDHKPVVKGEKKRIEAAGGTVSEDGRVNGLSLSRSFGHHSLKQKQDLPPAEQIITAVPDVKITPRDGTQDEFLVIASGDIWECMSSQQLCDFVGERIGQKGLQEIVEEVCERCCAEELVRPDGYNFGPGCENETVILIDLQKDQRQAIKEEGNTSVVMAEAEAEEVEKAKEEGENGKE